MKVGGKHLSQEQVARKLNVSRQAITKWDSTMALKQYFEKKTGKNIYDVVGKEKYHV